MKDEKMVFLSSEIIAVKEAHKQCSINYLKIILAT